MSDPGEKKFKWTHESTSLLVSVWSDNQVQQQLEYAPKPELVWESIARYMKKKGYNVTGKQCKSRIKQVFICYREAKRSGAKGSVEQYYDSIDRVLLNKKNNNENLYNVDTVDSAIKSPSKDVKTNKNLQTRHKFQEPANCVYRTNALTPTWINERDRDYPDSPESNETVLAQPYRVFSPVRDAATNTRHQLPTEKIKRNILPEENIPVKEAIKQTHLQNYFSDIPLQNAVQNVQNQIIHENMQQNQALLQQTLLQKRILEQNLMNPVFQPQFRTINQIPQPHVTAQNLYVENPVRVVQNQYQQSSVNQAVPQEPRRSNYMPNYGRQNYIDVNLIESASPSYSPDNLNDAFCQTNTETRHNLNETFNQPTSALQQNGLHLPNIDNTMMTNNATFNDDTLSIEFIHDSSSVSDNERPKSKDCSVNTDADLTPSAPFRKKKQQKLEQMMLNAINSQNDVVSKILSAQSDMVNRFLDVDRDRQNRLENRLDNLLDVVRATVLNKSSDKESDTGEAVITNLLPPPKPGSIPPKLDLVPPKPCRVPCTIANGPIDFINQQPITTRPGVVSPILSPPKKPTSWNKGPVSTSPFVKAQQQLGFQFPKNVEARTKSSAERRIAKDLNVGMDLKTLSLETMAFIEVEKQTEEKIENARRQNEVTDSCTRRKLFGSRDPTVAMVLTTAFLDAEKQSEEILESARIAFEEEKVAQLKNEFLNAVNNKVLRDDVLRGRGEDFEKIKQMDLQQKFVEAPCDTSTPAKFGQPNRNSEGTNQPRQTIQQLAQLVMNSARWRDAASARRPHPFITENNGPENKEREIPKIPPRKSQREIESNAKTLNWMQDRYSYPPQMANTNTLPALKNRFSYNGPAIAGVHPIGFTAEKFSDDEREPPREYGKRIGFVDELALPLKDVGSHDYLKQLKQLYDQHQEELKQKRNGNMIMAQQNDLIKQYVKDLARLRGNSDSDTDEEFLDTTATMHPPRRGSITSGASSKASKADKCVIS